MNKRKGDDEGETSPGAKQPKLRRLPSQQQHDKGETKPTLPLPLPLSRPSPGLDPPTASVPRTPVTISSKVKFDIQAPVALALPDDLIASWISRQLQQMKPGPGEKQARRTIRKGIDISHKVETSAMSAEEFSELFTEDSDVACAYVHCGSTKVGQEKKPWSIRGHRVCKACADYYRDHGEAMRSPQLCENEKLRESEEETPLSNAATPNVAPQS